jgi:hypothetical protein
MLTNLRPQAVRSRPNSLAVIVAFAGAGAAVLDGGVALASHVSCGDTVTADTTLDSDLVNCPNNGIVIGADNITLDLNGHTIDGDNALVDPCPENQFCESESPTMATMKSGSRVAR